MHNSGHIFGGDFPPLSSQWFFFFGWEWGCNFWPKSSVFFVAGCCLWWAGSLDLLRVSYNLFVREKREAIQGYFTASRKVARLGFHGSAASNGEGIWCWILGRDRMVCGLSVGLKGGRRGRALIYVILIFKVVLFVRWRVKGICCFHIFILMGPWLIAIDIL
jgi:hypothetical protein